MQNIYQGNAPSTGSRPSIIDLPGDLIDTDLPSGPGPEIMAASTLAGYKVVNRQDEDLGEIKEIMIDVLNGRVAYAVLSSGGVLGFGEKLHAIPWSALALDTVRHCFVLDIDAERLKAAPGFDKDHWPSMADTLWASAIYDYYGQRAYWQPRQAD